MKKILMLTLGLVGAGTLVVNGQSVGDPGPDFSVNLQGGGLYNLADQKGKVVFVYLFGNGCPYCIASGPTIESSIYQAFKDNHDFTAIGVDTWNSSSNEASVSGFRSKTGISFPLAIKAGAVQSSYQTTYDRLMVIDKNGTLVHKGNLAAGNDINNAVSAIENSLAEIVEVDCQTVQVNINHTAIQPSCPGDSDGSIDVTVSGDNPDFIYSWSNGSTTQDLGGLDAGQYELNVTDAEGCSDSIEVIISDPSAISITETIINPLCARDSSGSIAIDILGGTGPYTISWFDDSSLESVSGLVAGCYKVQVTDQKACIANEEFCISDTAAIVITETIRELKCEKDTTGSIAIDIMGGTGPYTISWFDGSSLDSLSGLGVGCYGVQVADLNDCVAHMEICLSPPEEIMTGEIFGDESVDGSSLYTYLINEMEGFTYHWIIEGGEIIEGLGSGAVDVQWGSSMNGVIQVISESEYGCLSDTTKLDIEINAVGINDSAAGSLSVYPNPVHDILHISVEKDVSISLMDMAGNIVMKTKHKQIDLSSLREGIYIIVIKSQNFITKKRIIKL